MTRRGTSQSNLANRLHQLVNLLDRGADKVLRQELGVSYNRALFLVVVEELGRATQHQLAIKLGYSDPSVSTMVSELVSAGLITVETGLDNKRKRIVSLTREGTQLVNAARKVLNKRLQGLLIKAEVDEGQLTAMIERVIQALSP